MFSVERGSCDTGCRLGSSAVITVSLCRSMHGTAMEQSSKFTRPSSYPAFTCGHKLCAMTDRMRLRPHSAWRGWEVNGLHWEEPLEVGGARGGRSMGVFPFGIGTGITDDCLWGDHAQQLEEVAGEKDVLAALLSLLQTWPTFFFLAFGKNATKKHITFFQAFFYLC